MSMRVFKTDAEFGTVRKQAMGSVPAAPVMVDWKDTAEAQQPPAAKPAADPPRSEPLYTALAVTVVVLLLVVPPVVWIALASVALGAERLLGRKKEPMKNYYTQ